jgi:hypothetical protein
MRIPSASNPTPSGAANSGTLGGVRAMNGRPGKMQLAVGDEFYLWVLILIEVGTMGFLRKHFRRYHGG